MVLLSALQSLPHLFGTVHIDDNSLAMLTTLVGMTGGIKFTMMRQRARVRRREERLKRLSQRDIGRREDP